VTAIAGISGAALSSSRREAVINEEESPAQR
jgi:hypothetical protein